MKSREETHNKIDELIQQITLHNNRLSLHEERLSQLDIDIMRKYCIDLYEHVHALVQEDQAVNRSAPQEVPVKVEPVVQTPEVEIPVQEVPEPKPAPEPIPEPEMQAEPEEVPPPPKEEPAAAQNVQKEIKKPKPIRKDEEEMISLFEKYNSKPIDNISKSISISKRFEFQNNFFDGDAQNYKDFIASLDSAGDREAAFEIYHEYKNRLEWDNEELKDELKSLLYRKYHN